MSKKYNSTDKSFGMVGYGEWICPNCGKFINSTNEPLKCKCGFKTTKVKRINGIKFFYSPAEIKMSDNMIKFLKQFNKEKAYSIYIDPSQGLVVF